MSAGMIPALDWPGLIRPGQFGPMIRVRPEFTACWKNSAVSSTGMPSVMTTTSGSPASIASITAALANLGGTNTTETSAPVASTASLTLPNTGTVAPSNSTDCPPLPGVTPPTMAVPELSIRWVCRRPSDPVMPCTITLESLVRKMATSAPSLRRSELGHATRGSIHGVHLLQARQLRIAEDLPSHLGVVAVEPDDERGGDLVAAAVEQCERLHDAVGHLVACGYPAEDVDQDAADVGVGEDDFQPVGHHFRRSTTADVEEVRGFDSPELLPRVRDHVERRHDQTCAVADDADLAVELDVVEVLLLGPGLQRIRGGRVLELGVVGMAEARVVVERDLSVEGHDSSVGGHHQRVDLDERRVL